MIGWPAAPEIEEMVCGEYVCLSQEDTIELAEWIHNITEVRRDLARCPLVVFH